MQQFIMDCSVSASWCFEDENDPYAEKILGSLKTHSALVPCI